MRPEDWTDERSRIVAAQAAAAERAAAKEAAQAQLLIDGFVAEAARRGVPPHPLRAPGPRGRYRYRTGLVGWYLSRDERVAVTTDGTYYVLRALGGLRERLLGATVEPMDPPLVVGRGARDGESIDLDKLLQRRLDEAG